MKKKLILLGVLVAIIIGGMSQAYASSGLQASVEYTEQYKIWNNLSESEKKNYIQPMMTPVPLKTKQVNNRVRATETLPTRYFLPDEINMKVKNQGITNQCWAFATTSVLESNIAKKTGKTSPFYSMRHMDYATSKTFADGTNTKGFSREVGDGGNYFLSMAYLTNGTGAVLESTMPFENNENKINLNAIAKKAVEKVDSYTMFPNIVKYKKDGVTVAYDGADTTYTQEQVELNRNNIKKYIMEYGAITALTESTPEYYNNPSDLFASTAYYGDGKNLLANHAITIVGWDDNYAISNFNPAHQPTQNGAYICLNSYGTESFDNGYIYISYEDALIESSNFGIKAASEIDYDEIYQNDFYGANASVFLTNSAGTPVQKQIYIASTFQKNTDKRELLKQIGLAVPTDMKVEVYVNTKGNITDISQMQKVYTSVGKLETGYQTITLDTPIEIGSKFAVAVKCNMDGNAYVRVQAKINNSFWEDVTSTADQSYVSMNGTNWQDFKSILDNTNISIKAFTHIDESTPPQEEENNNTTNNTVINVTPEGNNTDNNTDLGGNVVDNTVANMIIPKAGKIVIPTIGTALVIIIAIASYLGYRRYKKI